MRAYDIYLTLTSEPFWASLSRRVRWAASRYYAGVDSLNQLRALASRQPYDDERCLPPTLSEEQVALIVRLR